MSFDDYVLAEDEEFIRFCKEKNLAKSTAQKKYKNHLKNYTNFHQMSLRELVDEADEEEEKQIRMKRRKIRQRLIDFRTWMLIDKKFAGSTIKTNIISVKTFYKHHGIETPLLPSVVLNDSPNEHIEFEDLPTIDTIRTAMESTKKQNHKALILFAACTGSARQELVNFTFQQFLDGVAPFCHNPKNAQDVIDELDGKCEELEIIPVFRMRRSKTDYMYYTPITPECLQIMINYLKSEGLGLKPQDRFFQLGGWGVSSVFEQTNDKFNWGKRGSFRFFSSHRVRKFHASVIEDTDFANYIQGRKPDVIKETYFKKDVNRVREEYKKHMHKFNIYAHYDVMINSDAYKQLKNQFEDEKKQHADEVKEMQNTLDQQKEDYEAKIRELEEANTNLSSQVSNVEQQVRDLARTNDVAKIQEYAFNNETVVKYDLMKTVMELYDIDYQQGNIKYIDKQYLDDLILRAYLIDKNNKDGADRYSNEERRLKQTFGKDYSILKRKVELSVNQAIDADEVLKTLVSSKQREEINKSLIDVIATLLEDKKAVPFDEDEYINLMVEEAIQTKFTVYRDESLLATREFEEEQDNKKKRKGITDKELKTMRDPEFHY